MFDTGNTAFMLVASSLVMLMTPGLAFFYGGLVGRKNVLTIMIQSFVSMGVTTIIWWMYGYSLCFSGGAGGIIGNLDKAFLRGVNLNTVCPFGSGNIPEFVFMAYQMMFAIITPALITGAFSNRIRFGAYLAFLVGWLTFVYFPFVHMVWGGGLLAKLGVLDFAGGIVVHNIAGMAALASVLYVGRRKVGDSIPHSIPLVALGTGLLWFGWYGFNAGSELRVDAVTGLAFLNTDIAASFAGPTWLLLAWIFERKPKFLGLLTGAVAGLATITPCAGYVTPTSAVIIGIAAGAVCYAAVNLKNRLKWDDALDVWGVHGVGGGLGIVLLGLMADKAVNAAGADGLLHGNSGFFTTQVVTVVVSSIYAFGFTYVMLKIINIFTRVRTSLDEEEKGLDASLHGESAYDEEVIMAAIHGPEPLPVRRRQLMNRATIRSGTAVLLGLLGIAAAAPKAGATASTHIWAPSTDVQRFNSLHVTSDLYVPVERSASGGRLPSVTNLGLTWGVLPFRNLNLELGVDHKSGYGALDAYPLYGNGKLGIPEGAFSRFLPALAVGIFDVGLKRGVTDYNVVYGKAARTLGPVGRLSAGYFRGNAEAPPGRERREGQRRGDGCLGAHDAGDLGPALAVRGLHGDEERVRHSERRRRVEVHGPHGGARGL